MAARRGKFPPNHIETKRRREGLSMEDLAERLGCDRSTINKLEKADRELTKEWLYKIADALGCSPHDLLLGPAAEVQHVVDLYEGLSEPRRSAAFTVLEAMAHRDRSRD